jgi:hypothetical protein
MSKKYYLRKRPSKNLSDDIDHGFAIGRYRKRYYIKNTTRVKHKNRGL